MSIPTFLGMKMYFILDAELLISVFKRLRAERPVCGIDFETSSIKPQQSDRRIYCMSISFNNMAVCFPIDYPKIPGEFPTRCTQTFWGENYLKIKKEISRFLFDKNIPKIAHNTSFENIWAYFFFGKDIANLNYCSMQAAHILDSRTDFTSLKLQGFIRFGVYGYEKESRKYLQKNKCKYSLNTLYKMPLEQLLLYCIKDSIILMKLSREQTKELIHKSNRGLLRAQRLFMQTSKAFMNCQKTGICIDTEYFKEQQNKIREHIELVDAKLNEYLKTPRKSLEGDSLLEVLARKTGFDLNQKFNSNSNPVLSALFYDILGEKVKKKTRGGQGSVDKEALAGFKSPIAKIILAKRQWEKLISTYIPQYLREECNGKIYPFLHTHFARTGRSSCSDPNLQQIPKRNEVLKKIVRRGIIPFPNEKFIELDFSSIEVRIIGCESRDPILLDYLNDPTTDMHRDQSKELFLLNDAEINGKLRYEGKSNFVFLEFYGGKAESSAWYLWKNALDIRLGKEENGPALKQHLAKKGIKNIENFTEHVVDVEKKLWKKFAGVKEWQKQQVKSYLKHGYLETHFGFRRSGYMTLNALFNTTIQSTAAHLLWWCFKEVNRAIKEEKMTSKLLLQVHDDMILSIPPEEEKKLLLICYETMIMRAAKRFNWIIVPLDIEVERGEVNASLYDISPLPKDEHEEFKEEILWGKQPPWRMNAIATGTNR
jgi:DNA polymerase-1